MLLQSVVKASSLLICLVVSWNGKPHDVGYALLNEGEIFTR